MAATQFFIMGMGFLDTAMSGNYDSVHLAGVALGSNVLWPIFMLFTGCTMAVTPIAAQLVGAGRTDEVGVVVRQALIVAACLAALAVALVLNAAPLFALFEIDPAAADIAERYLAAAAWGLPPVMVYVVLRYASEGLGRTVGPMVIVGTMLLVNAVLNYVFIYGKFGAPELGGEGCGWATAIVMWCEFGAMILLSRFRYFRATGLWQRLERPDWRRIGHLLWVGLPIGLSSFVGMGLFALIGFLVGHLGVVPLAAHSIAGHINWATFVIPMALGAAAGIRIGFFVGAGELAAARHVAKVAVTISLGYALAVSAALVLLRHGLVAIYSNDAEVTGLAAGLLILIAIYQVFDDLQGTATGALRGYKDTRVPMVYTIIGYWLFSLPLGIALAYGLWEVPALGVYGFWVALSFGLAAVAIAISLRLYRTGRNPERIMRLAH